MALLRKSELRSLNDQAIAEKMKELKKERAKVEMQRATGTTLASPARPRQIRRTIAQLNTIMHAKKLKIIPQQKPKGGDKKPV